MIKNAKISASQGMKEGMKIVFLKTNGNIKEGVRSPLQLLFLINLYHTLKFMKHFYTFHTYL